MKCYAVVWFLPWQTGAKGTLSITQGTAFAKALYYDQRFCFSRRYIIVLKPSVREIEREATIQKSTPIIYSVAFNLNDPELSVLSPVRLVPNPVLLTLLTVHIVRYSQHLRQAQCWIPGYLSQAQRPSTVDQPCKTWRHYLKLLENPKVFGRKKPLIVSILTTNRGFTKPQEHRLIKISKRGYCIIFKTIKERLVRRQALAEIDRNKNKRRKHSSESQYAYIGYRKQLLLLKGRLF